MKRFTILFVFFFSVFIANSQRSQRVAYIDMEYILENVPEYLTAQNTLNSKVTKWRSELDKLTRFIEKLKTDLTNEKAILTQAIIVEKEDEITLKQKELRRLEELYFGPKGDMFLLRKQLVQPIQDQVYNAVQTIATTRKYDFIFDKSSELFMMYSNKKYDISDLVLSSIVRDRKVKQLAAKRAAAKKPAEKKELTEAQKLAIKKREDDAKKKEADRIARKKKIQDARKKRLAEIEKKRALLKKNKESAKKKKDDNNKEDNN